VEKSTEREKTCNGTEYKITITAEDNRSRYLVTELYNKTWSALSGVKVL